ncbi:endo-1,4-beta-xylanase [Streptomyces sp. NPDC001835]|uniref:endo-1,4-beta-xylanase n=1 Tax=Streptomyces sp. NPDC001835 TaxID=3154528 RepID=UPI0033270926
MGAVCRHVVGVRHAAAAREVGPTVPVGEDEEDGRQPQADEMAGKLRVCLEEPNCTSFSTWGFTDRYGSTADTKIYPARTADSLPWDAALRPKPAYERLLEAFDEA